MTLPDTNFLLTLLPIVLAAAVAAFVIVVAFAWLSASRRAEKVEAEVEQLRIEKDQEHVAKHLALTERDTAVRAFQVREEELRELERQLADAKAEAARRAGPQRQVEIERRAAPRDATTTLPGGDPPAPAAHDDSVIALTATVERMRSELEIARVELARKDARLGEMDALKRQLELANTRILDAQTAAQREAEKVARITTATGGAAMTESALVEAQSRIDALERKAADLLARARAAEVALVTGDGAEIAARFEAIEAERDAALDQVRELQKRAAKHEAETADNRVGDEAESTAYAAGRIAGLEADLQALRAELAEIRAHASADLEGELGEARAELARRGAQIAELSALAPAASVPSPDARDAEITRLTAELAAARAAAVLPDAAEFGRMRDALATAQAEAADQEARVGLLRNDLNAVTLRAAALSEEKAALAASLEKTRAESQTTLGRLSALTETASALEAQVREAQTQLSAQHAVTQRMASSLRAAEAQGTEASGSATGTSTLGTQLADARARSLALEQILAERDRRIEALTARISQTERSMADQASGREDVRARSSAARGAPAAPSGADADPDRDHEQTDAQAYAETDKDGQIATLRRQLGESMTSLRRAMDELADRDAHRMDASVRLEKNEATEAPEVVEAHADPEPEAASPLERSPNRKPSDDALEEIVGIGPTIARRLRMAGIRTFRQVAEAAPQRLEEVARLPDWRKSNFKAWIDQARQLAGDS